MPSRKKPVKPAAPAPQAKEPAAPLAITETLAAIKDVRDIGPSVVEQMMSLIPPSVVADKINAMMHATRWIGNGEHMREVPDTRAQEAGVKLYLAYVVGMPVQRSESIVKNLESEDQTMERAAKSPATRRHMRRMLDAMDEADGSPVEPA